MGIFFSASEIIQFALRIEENGAAFYELMAKKVRTKEIKDMFSFLAEEERNHWQTFNDMLSKVEKYTPPESYPGEYFEYLKAFADEYIFTKEKTGQMLARQIKSAKEALKFAIDIEIASILYYIEAKNLVPKKQREIIDRIIEEERKHYLKLIKIKKG